MRITAILAVLLFACLANGLAACSSMPYAGEGEHVARRSPAGPYAVRMNDQLRIQVYNEPTISGDYVVDRTGYISVPAAGRLKASGLTVDQLERKVIAQLNSGILKDARVSIQITTYAPFYIRGEVKKPGEFPYKPGMTIANAVALAGGYTYRADESTAYVRPADATLETARPMERDPDVAPGDNIRIPERFL